MDDLKLTVRKKFADALPPLNDTQFRILERSLLYQGCVSSPILYWFDGKRNVVIDGHQRLKIARKHSLRYKTEPLVFENDQDALMWILFHAGSSRCSRQQQQTIIARTYNLAKGPRGGDHRSAAFRSGLTQKRFPSVGW